MKTARIKSECEGCRMFNMSQCEIGLYPELSEDLKCPCLVCLVKGMCNEACKEFRQYTKRTYSDREMFYGQPAK